MAQSTDDEQGVAPADEAGPGSGPTAAVAGRRRRARAAVAIGAVVAVAAVLLAAVVVTGEPVPEADRVQTAAAPEPGTTATTRRARAATPLRPSTTTEAPAPVTEPPPPPPAPTTVAPAPTTTVPVTAVARAPAPAPPPPPAPAAVPSFPAVGIAPFVGLGAWLDVLDWSPSYTGGSVSVTPAAVDRLADHGVQTLYIQTSRFNRPEDVLDPAVLGQFIDRAHARGIRVVGWYLPTHVDPDTDLRRLLAAAALPVDGVGVDIESTAQTDIAARNQHLVDLSVALRGQTAKPLAAIVLPPVVTEQLNRAYWPQFPWTTVAGLYDAFLPMAYWSNRTAESGWRDGYRYIAENTTLLRRLTGRADLAVHPVGGIANEVTTAEVAAMGQALVDTGAIGGSLYDVATTGDALWPGLAAFRR